MAQAISDTMAMDGPVVCEVMLDENIPFAPKLGAKIWPDGRITSPPLEDLSPFLSREELRENMLIDFVDEP
jgi:acetolactate synthase-1/2/3 large subunit